MDGARPDVGDLLHHGHPERLLPAQQGPVNAEEEGGHEDLRVLEGVAERYIERGRYDGVGMHEQQEIPASDARSSIQGRSAPANGGRGAAFVACW